MIATGLMVAMNCPPLQIPLLPPSTTISQYRSFIVSHFSCCVHRSPVVCSERDDGEKRMEKVEKVMVRREWKEWKR